MNNRPSYKNTLFHFPENVVDILKFTVLDMRLDFAAFDEIHSLYSILQRPNR